MFEIMKKVNYCYYYFIMFTSLKMSQRGSDKNMLKIAIDETTEDNILNLIFSEGFFSGFAAIILKKDTEFAYFFYFINGKQINKQKATLEQQTNSFFSSYSKLIFKKL